MCGEFEEGGEEGGFNVEQEESTVATDNHLI